VGGSAAGAEVVQVARCASIPGLELITIHNSARLWTVFHTSFDFCTTFGTAPGVPWTYRCEEHYLTRNSVGLLEPGELHRVPNVREATEYAVLLVERGALCRLCGDDRRDLHWRFGQVESPSLASCLRSLWTRIARPDHGALEFELVVADFLKRLIAMSAEPAAHPLPAVCPRAARRAREFLTESFAADLTFAQYAEQIGISASHLHRSFRAEYGITPHQYRMYVRISRARDLLRGGISIADTAALAGFTDQAHMTTSFRRHFGVTPGTYAVSCGAGKR